MTEYLGKCEEILAPISIHMPALHYILEEYHSNPDIKTLSYPEVQLDERGENVLQRMFDKSPLKMRMYGSAKELAENVKIYMNFPNSHQYLSTEYEPFATTPTIYENLKNEKFICKLDLFPILQNMIYRSFEETNEPSQVFFIIEPLLKFELNRLNGKPEFVRFDQKVLDEIWAEIQNAQKTLQKICDDATPLRKLAAELNNLNDIQLLFKLKSYVPNNWDKMDIFRIHQFLIKLLNDFCDNDEEFGLIVMTAVFTQSKVLYETLRNVIDERPELFRLYSETKKGPVTVRLFEDNGNQYVMKMELFNALRESGTTRIDYTDREDMFDTMKMEEIIEKYGDEIKNIEFIHYPIMRAKHRAVPVNGPDPTNSNRFCILAVDALLETLRSIIMEYQRFQKFQHGKEYDWNSLSESFDHFFKQTESPYFIACFVVDIIRNAMKEGMNILKAVPAKSIRNAKKDGFTLQNLKNELAHLNLIVAFPEIQDYAEVVYEHVNRVKKERFLRTCDLIDAIENCQLICLFERMPNLKKFLHSQGGCGRVIGLKCQLCMDQQKTSEDQEPQKLQASDSSLPSIESNTQNALEPFSDSAKKEMEEKLLELEQEILQKTKENKELHVANIKLAAENETKSEMVEKLMNKLSIGSSSKSVLELN